MKTDAKKKGDCETRLCRGGGKEGTLRSYKLDLVML